MDCENAFSKNKFLLLPTEIIAYLPLDRLSKHLFSLTCSQMRNIFGVDYMDMMNLAETNNYSSVIVWLRGLNYKISSYSMTLTTAKLLESEGYAVGRVNPGNYEETLYAIGRGWLIDFTQIMLNRDIASLTLADKYEPLCYQKEAINTSLEIIKLLLQSKNLYSKITIYQTAASYGRIDILEHFRREIDVKYYIQDLYIAAHVSALDWLYSNFPRKDSRILMDAVETGNVAKVKWMVNKGFDLSVVKRCSNSEIYKLLGRVSEEKLAEIIECETNIMVRYINSIDHDDNFTHQHHYLWNNDCTEMARRYKRFDLIDAYVGYCNFPIGNDTACRWIKNKYPQVYAHRKAISQAKGNQYKLAYVKIQ